MIQELLLKIGSESGNPSLAIPKSPVTVFVGPNNSGKSRVLEEIRQICNGGHGSDSRHLVEELRLVKMTPAEAKAELEQMRAPPPVEQHFSDDTVWVYSTMTPGGGPSPVQVNKNAFLDVLCSTAVADPHARSVYLHAKLAFLNGANRLRILDPQSMGNLNFPPANTLQKLFRFDDKRERLRKIVHETTGLYIAIDPTNGGQLLIKLHRKAPTLAEEKGLGKEAVLFHSQGSPLEEISDGVKAFSGILAELIAGDPRLILIDEPEAFLHPPMATRLGKEIAKLANENRKTVFASTHSPAFLMGCVQSGVPVNIVRLTYKHGKGTARLLEASKVNTLMRDPRLRSVGVLNGLFYDSVVVTEGNSDRVFYQEINERLSLTKPDQALQDCLFLDAGGKDTLHAITKPLRELGIPASSIADLDILSVQDTKMRTYLSGGYFDEADESKIHQEWSEVLTELNSKLPSWKSIFTRGLDEVPGELGTAVGSLLRLLSRNGLFVVPVGALEAWLGYVPIEKTKNKRAFLDRFLDIVGYDQEHPCHLHPTDGDVWEFIHRIKTWNTDPKRSGIPK